MEGVTICVMLLTALMGPLRGPLVLFPYGLLSLWLGYSWQKGWNWWLSWSVGVSIGTMGFLIRVLVLSILLGENLWVILTRAGAGLLEKGIDVFNLSFTPDMKLVQIVVLFLVITQEIVYVLCLHALAYWIFPRLKSSIPEPPAFLENLLLKFFLSLLNEVKINGKLDNGFASSTLTPDIKATISSTASL